MERAYLVRRVTAYRLCEIMRKNQFDGSEARAVEGVMDCDLLFIDDLGTEPQTKNTSGYLFQVINERNMNDRHTIISTNLNPERMEGIYEQRVASRLMDVSRTTAIRFYGGGLRQESEGHNMARRKVICAPPAGKTGSRRTTRCGRSARTDAIWQPSKP